MKKKVYSRVSGGLLNKGDQAAVILCASIYALALGGDPKPTRSRVLEYIRVGKLVAYLPVSADDWITEDGFAEQFFSWCREDIATKGLIVYLGSIDHGFWGLSQHGRDFVEQRVDKWCAWENLRIKCCRT
jgi:hypothetical protein